MHPVLAKTLNPIAEEIAAASLAEAQVSPNPGKHRWSGQQVVEHLILMFHSAQEELQTHLKKHKPASNWHTLLQWLLKAQLCWFGSMSPGIPSRHAIRPRQFVPQDGPALAARLLAEAEDADKALVQCRREFGLQSCGYHPIYGPLRVDEWRNYFAIHSRHHLPQFREAIAYARSHPELLGLPVPAVVPGDDDSDD